MVGTHMNRQNSHELDIFFWGPKPIDCIEQNFWNDICSIFSLFIYILNVNSFACIFCLICSFWCSLIQLHSWKSSVSPQGQRPRMVTIRFLTTSRILKFTLVCQHIIPSRNHDFWMEKYLVHLCSQCILGRILGKQESKEIERCALEALAFTIEKIIQDFGTR